MAAADKAPPSWAATHRDELAALLLTHGSVLVSGLQLRTAEDLAEVRTALGLRPARLHEQFAERRSLGHDIYSAPLWPADREECLHHEQGYGIDFPRVMVVAWLVLARAGGAMLIGDTRAALDLLPPELIARFRADGWLLERNFLPYFGLRWSAALGASSPDEAERICAERAVDWSWGPDGVLHLVQRRSGVVRHPVTGAAHWFNDGALFNHSRFHLHEPPVLVYAVRGRGLPLDT